MKTKEILKQYWGFDDFRPLQEDIINAVLQKQDTLALLPTGGGKSICFQVPVMTMDGICIVISPLIALMKDQVENLQKKGIQAITIVAGMGKREIDIALDNCIYGPIKFLYISPERLLSDLVQERIKYMNVNLLAVDEAHCVSQWGYDFRPPYLHIAAFRNLHPEVPILALTASATNQVQLDIMEKLGFKKPNIFRKSFERKNLSYSVLKLENKLQKVLDVCNNVIGSGILYVKTRKDTVELAKYLNQNLISAQYYHAGLNLEERAQKQQFWINNKVKVMVATNAFGMGIDKPDVRFVIHYEIPDSLESYYQEAGRAGRDEKKAYAVILFQDRDRILMEKKFIQNFPKIDEIKQVYHYLCNYLQIPFSVGEGVTYDFNLADFCLKFKLEIIKTLSAIKFLEHNEYFVLSENALISSRINFLVNGDYLYKFQVENAKYDLFIRSILRMYGGAFDQFVNINESDIARKNSLNRMEIINLLKELDQLEILSYQKQTDQPLLTFTQPRYQIENLIIDKKYLEDRKEIYQQKMKGMLDFVESKYCRSVQLLEYFEETDAQKCGVCDICLQEKRNANQQLKSQMNLSILAILKLEKLTLKQLLNAIKLGSEKEKMDMIRLMLDTGVIDCTENLYHI